MKNIVLISNRRQDIRSILDEGGEKYRAAPGKGMLPFDVLNPGQ